MKRQLRITRKMTPEERQRYAYDLRQSGKIWLEVGRELGGVTSVRARELSRLHERRKRMLKYATTEWEKMLIRRTYRTEVVNNLRNLGLSNNPEMIVKLGPANLLKEKNISKKFLSRVALLLKECGYINDADAWIGIRQT